MKLSKRMLASALAMMLGVSLLAGCGGQKEAPKDAGKAQAEISGTVTASGSTALLPFLKPAQEEFQKKNPKVTVNIAGGGSFTGMNQVAAGSVNIGNSDVFLTAELKDKGLVDHQVAVAPFVFIANTDVTVDNLTQQQYTDIFTGKITNWNEVGGKDQKISIIHRAKSSGSRATIAEIVLKNAAFTDNAVIQDSNGAVKAAIASTPGSIGYVDAAYADNSVKTLAYNGEKYTPESVINGKYPVFAYEHMYTKGEPTGAVKAFIDFVMSKEFQEAYAAKSGFIPITSMKK
ncbi:phosphate ABC transporter substrate-binding protein [Sporomusa acidovorans]|uniref:Phosphate-binding protein n=1 Tax=Sporomusa acidovorans (strain ATCC 49682 / DSM 3132 / Mol) TaxID=1123286 RepID=A0ABZ3IWB4_SPOA4|nr:phosphate ABC transporter substrate-binding protein [Sporomusa acidovorans]OZC23670.1 phosphate-binding protein PstS 1 precursor [Sporomusa acidovorans DSM 3132]SDE24610.1 phosphate ABC transporter substrate-binding protein, PhoT family [Sporomusa acidovorans]